jgi:hypothetical protein
MGCLCDYPCGCAEAAGHPPCEILARTDGLPGQLSEEQISALADDAFRAHASRLYEDMDEHDRWKAVVRAVLGMPEQSDAEEGCAAHGLAHPCEVCAVESQYEQVLDDHRRLVRELDVLLNGEAGAAKQASLCDIVGQVRREGIRADGVTASDKPVTEAQPLGHEDDIQALCCRLESADLRDTDPAVAAATIRSLCGQIDEARTAGAGASAEPEPWVPYLSDRADGVKGHYAICRWNPGSRGLGYREAWNLRSHSWASCSDEVLTLEQAQKLLAGLTLPSGVKEVGRG